LLVPSEDPAALATALDSLLSDADLRRRFSERGIAEVRARFGINRYIEQLDALYAQALAG
jgi:glycosyltransferase involved in cell wall biosynthesis